MTDGQTVALEATGISYGSQNDEAAFFGRLDSIAAVESYAGGHGRTEVITVSLDSIDEDGLREFVALYRRYDIEPRELRVLNAGRFGAWFSDPDRWWYNEVFGQRPIDNELRSSAELDPWEDKGHKWDAREAHDSHANVWPNTDGYSDTKVELIARGVTFYSHGDEKAFFQWLNRIPGFESYQGQDSTLRIAVNPDIGEEWDPAEFVALYRRYNIDIRELRVLFTSRLDPWYSDPKRYWHNDIFG
ncbi:hypothetical protein [Mycobacteroides salmoniphilum]|uniref:Uncharacterized protein n=1 Tax=Mycobacteroides salmoniphilum TaxID=404941 RepID=A0A4R8SA67_9MYCO|nr:hypothetical protein [Mycobacteroides salmoniphilum]TDZ90218.1 hypothetical protein CCUG60885_04864 [Mycobacteroides salmoniphilum]TEA00184.1 hypothetical protein CCUG60883_04867 [Mycobacteroides salmoniphilum]